MSPLIRPDAPEPILILGDDEYRRAFSPPPPPRPRRRIGRGIAWGVLLAAVAAGTAAWLAREKPRPPEPLLARAPAPPPRASEPPIPEPPPPPPRAAVVPVSPPAGEEEDPPVTTPDPSPRPAPPPWHGGRAWVLLRLRMEHRSQVQESERRVILVEEGSRFIVERTAAGPADLWLERLELLLQLPAESDGWQRQVRRTGAETIHLQRGDLACRVVEGEDRFPQGVRRFRYWYSDEFPAGAVRAEQTLGDTVFACRVLDFGPATSRKP